MASQLSVNIPATKAKTYPVIIQSGLLKNPFAWLPGDYDAMIIITDDNVKQHFALALQKMLISEELNCKLISFPAGEKSKTRKTKSQIEKQMLLYGCDRNTLILAIGGGVVGDMAGFVAATFMRGIACIQIPTTLLAMLDSSVGGKTGIDTAFGKNLIGAFWHPKAVISDIDCLHSLPQTQLINGLIEAIKIFLTSDAESFDWLEKNLAGILSADVCLLTELVTRGVGLKAAVVEADEREAGLRTVLNFGHTIGHALEKLSNYQLLHGYAVALGILVEAKMAALSGILAPETFLRIKALMHALDISTAQLKAFNQAEILKITRFDKKKARNQIHYVLLKDIGKVYQDGGKYVHPVSDAIVMEALFAL